jgi:tRNA(fMet)-specific endonuclease VapC
MVLCDTNILIEFYKNTPHIIQELKHITLHNLAISAITKGELYFGALNKVELQKIKQHIKLLHQFFLTKTISKKFIALMETYCLSYKLSIPDSIIAATAIVHDIELYTLNKKDFQYISNIKLYHTKIN